MPEQFEARFGPSEGDYRAIVAFALSNHLSIVTTRPSRRLLEVSGTVGDIQRAFHVNLNHYRRPDGSLFFAPGNEPSIDLDVPVLHVGGLDNYQVPKPLLHASSPQAWTGPSPKSNSSNFLSAPNAMANSGSAPAGLYWGTDFRNAYVPGVCLTGTGQTVALIEFEGYYDSDILGYESLAGLPNVPVTNVLIDGYSGTPDKRNDANGIIEVSLDIEMAISMAPGLSQVRVYEVQDTAPVAAADMMLDQIATDGKTNPINQISCSWTGFGDTASETYFEQFAMQGQAFFQAAGDDGAYVPGDPEPTVPVPINFSSNIEMTVVGGTQLMMNGSAYQSETTWNAPLAGVTYGGGGGVCSAVPILTYQQVVNMTANGGSTVSRNIPDVSMVADNIFVVADKSYTSTTNYKYYTVVGTSAAAPLWAGFLALANQQGAGGGVTVGSANRTLYPIGMGANYTSDFNDIKDGSTNNLNGNPNLYKAVSGYDLATGWGSPRGQSMINALTGLPAFVCTPTPTVTLAMTPTSTRTLTRTPTNTATNSDTPTATNTATNTATSSRTQTSTNTPSLTATVTASNTQTNTVSPTPTFSPTNTVSDTFTGTASKTPTNSATATSTFTSTGTPSDTAASTQTNTVSSTDTLSPTGTPSDSPTSTASGTLTNTSTVTSTATPTNGPSNTLTTTPVPTSTNTITNSPSDTSTSTQTNTATSTSTLSPTDTPSDTASATPTNSTTATSTATFTGTPSSTLTNTPLPTLTDTPSNTFTSTKTNTASSTATLSSTNTSTSTASGTSTFTLTATSTATSTGTPSATLTPTATSTNTPKDTVTSTQISTATSTASSTVTPIDTDTPTQTSTKSPIATASSTASNTTTSTDSNTPTNTATLTPSNTATLTMTGTPTLTASGTSTSTLTTTSTVTPTGTPSNTLTPTSTSTNKPSDTATNTQTSTATSSASSTATPINSDTPTNSPTVTASSTSTRTPIATPTQTSSATSTATPTVTFTNTSSHSPTSTFTPTRTNTPTATDTFTGTFTLTPTLSMTETATMSSTPTPVETSTATLTTTPGSLAGAPTPGWTVRPTLSRGGEPIDWQIVLTSPSQISLGLYDVAGELVYKTSIQGNAGLNSISWDLQNLSGQKVASGLYVYFIQIAQGFPFPNPRGKILILN